MSAAPGDEEALSPIVIQNAPGGVVSAKSISTSLIYRPGFLGLLPIRFGITWWESYSSVIASLRTRAADMMRVPTAAFCFFLITGHAAGQSIRLKGFQLALPQGYVIGAAFDGESVFIQQAVPRTVGTKVLVTRRVVVWSLKGNSLVKERTLTGASSTLAGNQCGRVEIEHGLNRVLVCANDRTLALLDADSLETVSEFNCSGRIFDFAVDQSAKMAFAVWESAFNELDLTTFDIASGRRLTETTVPAGAIADAQLAIDPRAKRIALAESRYGGNAYTTSLFACSYGDQITCDTAPSSGQVAQIAILGQEVLLASGVLADDPHECILSVNLATDSTSREYCAPGTGVHHGIGIVAGKYVVGYTGVEKRLHWKETTVNVSSSVSVWRYEDKKIAARAEQEGTLGPFPEGARIASDWAHPRFLLYSQTSDLAYLYAIIEDSSTKLSR